MKKTIIYTILQCIGVSASIYIGFAIGRFDTATGINYKTAYLAEKAIASASLELNHLFYSNEDNDFWFDVVVPTKEYQHLDSVMNGDWEDFHYYETPLPWNAITYTPGYSY